MAIISLCSLLSHEVFQFSVPIAKLGLGGLSYCCFCAVGVFPFLAVPLVLPLWRQGAHFFCQALFNTFSFDLNDQSRPELFSVLAQQLQSADILTSHRIFMILFRTLKELSTKRLTSDQRNFAEVQANVPIFYCCYFDFLSSRQSFLFFFFFFMMFVS